MPYQLMAGVWLALGGWLFPGSGSDSRAQDVPPAPVAVDAAVSASSVRLIRIPLPIQGMVDTQVMRSLNQVLDGFPVAAQRPTVVLEFWPADDGLADGSEFGRALTLAQYLISPRLSRVRTVAYLPKTLTGHAVLVALACEEIIMNPDASIGNASVVDKNIDPIVRQGYREIAERRQTIPAAVALGMLDPQLHVQRVKTPTGTRYVLADEVERIQRNTVVQAVDTVISAGDIGLLRGDRLRLEYGFVSHLAADRNELAAALDVSPSALEIDPALGGKWYPVRVELRGPINNSEVSRIIRTIEDRRQQGSLNFICLSLDSPGGAPQESLRLANFLANLDASQIRTVAYIGHEARCDAALIAAGCNHLIMEHDATIGGEGAYQMNADEVANATEALRAICGDASRRWSMFAALLDPELHVYRYALAGGNTVDYLCEAEWKELPNHERWQRNEEITKPDQPLILTGDEATDFRLARQAVAGFPELLRLYQLEDEPELLQPNWAHELVHALASPQLSALLLFVAMVALMIELSAPGIGIGGFVSALCFLMFFWSHFLNGTAGWLEVMLFLGGVTFVGLEIFVLPGFGIFGLGGGAMILASLVLASQTFVLPENAYQVEQLPGSLLIMLSAIIGLLVSGVFLRHYVTRLPLLRRVALAPPDTEELRERLRRETISDLSGLLHHTGHAVTPIAPSGKAQIGDRIVDVLSDGEVISRGQPIVVVEAIGNRVIVGPA